jgi:hypothetical protein
MGGVIVIKSVGGQCFEKLEAINRNGHLVLSEAINQLMTHEERRDWIDAKVAYIKKKYPGVWQMKREREEKL